MESKINILPNYTIKDILGKGTFSYVKLAVDNNTGKELAIKILEKNRVKNKRDSQRIEREINLVKKISHLNIVKVFDVKEDNEKYYILMEYCENGELFNLILQKHKLSEDEAAYYYYQIINGLEYIQSQNIIHRDLKPENLLLTKDNILKIIDFGLSNYNPEDNLLSTPCGSPCYASPEMVSGKKYNGFTSDVWSTGIILYAMIYGYLPFENNGFNNDVLFKKISECRLDYPKTNSIQALDLLQKILVPDCNKRIKIDEIKKHQFYLKGKAIFNKKFRENNAKNINDSNSHSHNSEKIKNSETIENSKINQYKRADINKKEKSPKDLDNKENKSDNKFQISRMRSPIMEENKNDSKNNTTKENVYMNRNKKNIDKSDKRIITKVLNNRISTDKYFSTSESITKPDEKEKTNTRLIARRKNLNYINKTSDSINPINSRPINNNHDVSPNTQNKRTTFIINYQLSKPSPLILYKQRKIYTSKDNEKKNNNNDNKIYFKKMEYDINQNKTRINIRKLADFENISKSSNTIKEQKCNKIILTNYKTNNRLNNIHYSPRGINSRSSFKLYKENEPKPNSPYNSKKRNFFVRRRVLNEINNTLPSKTGDYESKNNIIKPEDRCFSYIKVINKNDKDNNHITDIDKKDLSKKNSQNTITSKRIWYKHLNKKSLEFNSLSYINKDNDNKDKEINKNKNFKETNSKIKLEMKDIDLNYKNNFIKSIKDEGKVRALNYRHNLEKKQYYQTYQDDNPKLLNQVPLTSIRKDYNLKKIYVSNKRNNNNFENHYTKIERKLRPDINSHREECSCDRKNNDESRNNNYNNMREYKYHNLNNNYKRDYYLHKNQDKDDYKDNSKKEMIQPKCKNIITNLNKLIINNFPPITIDMNVLNKNNMKYLKFYDSIKNKI